MMVLHLSCSQNWEADETLQADVEMLYIKETVCPKSKMECSLWTARSPVSFHWQQHCTAAAFRMKQHLLESL
jgi:hypothetical protein